MELRGHKDEIYAAVVWQGRIYSAGYDKLVIGWDEQGQKIVQMDGHVDSVNVLLAHEDCLYSGSSDGKILVWGTNHSLLRVRVTQRKNTIIFTFLKKKLQNNLHEPCRLNSLIPRIDAAMRDCRSQGFCN